MKSLSAVSRLWLTAPMARERNLIDRLLVNLPQNQRLFRNTVGLFETKNGQRIQTGLCVGSSDLIGWTARKITAEDVGKTLAVFTAIEIKSARTSLSPEQGRFLQAVANAGGVAEVRKEKDGNLVTEQYEPTTTD